MPGLSDGMLGAGDVIEGRYRVIRPIKAGAMGMVYEVFDARTNGACAMKLMLPALGLLDDERDRFVQEARLTGKLGSEHVVRVLDAGHHRGAPFLVMELLQGEELQDVLDRRGSLRPEEAILYLSHAALALQETQAANIIHRDLKPANLFVTVCGDGSPCVKVFDFGVAKLWDPDGSRRKTRTLGTPIYMAPEQISGEGDLDARVDLYALGHVAYALLTGEPYWSEESAAVLPMLIKIVEGATEPASVRAMRRTGTTLPPGFDAWFAKATAVDPRRRFGGAAAQIDALRDLFAVHEARRRFVEAPTAVGTVAPSPAILDFAHAPTALQHLPPTELAFERPRSSGRWRWKVGGVAATVMVAGVAAAAVYRLAIDGSLERDRRASSSRPVASLGDSSSTPSTSPLPPGPPPLNRCGKNVACAPFDTPNPRKVPLELFMERAAAMAKRYEPSAVLNGALLTGELQGGGFDTTKSFNATVDFRSEKGPLAVTISSSTAFITHSNALPNAWAGPPCAVDRALVAAKEAGFSGAGDSTIALITFGDRPFWIFPEHGTTISVAALTCAVSPVE